MRVEKCFCVGRISNSKVLIRQKGKSCLKLQENGNFFKPIWIACVLFTNA